MTSPAAREPRIVGRPDGTYQIVYAGRVLASCDSYMEAAEWIEEWRGDALGVSETLC